MKNLKTNNLNVFPSLLKPFGQCIATKRAEKPMRFQLRVPHSPLLSLVSVRSMEAVRPLADEAELFRLAAADSSPDHPQSSFARIDWTAVGAAAFVYAIAFAAWVLLAR
ncbi:MAG TPA: hypothetical protein VM009_08470 [Terriglobales bacterium]|nr:hypothetical protein [Terriglobales bacterium]